MTSWARSAPLLARAGVRDPLEVAREREARLRAEAEAAEELRRAEVEAARRAALTPDQREAEQVAACLAALRALPARRQVGRLWTYVARVAEHDGVSFDDALAAGADAPVGAGYHAVWWWRQARRRGLATLDDLRRDAGLL